MYGSLRRVVLLAGLLVVMPGLVDAAGALKLRVPSATSSSTTSPTWAPAATASIHPGAETVTGGGQCTANFVFTDNTGGVYLGQAAHCSSTGGATDTDGCTARSLPLETKVTIEGARNQGTMVYNSWLTMQTRGEADDNVCAFNDFALIKLDPADVGDVNPSVPFFGGPVGLATAGTQFGDSVYSYGNSSLRLGLSDLSPKRGLSVGDDGKGWSHLVYTVTPGVPGDSGSAFLDASGNALGVLSTLQLLPLTGSNGVGDLSKELAYLKAHSGLPGIQLALGTEAFTPDRLL